MEVIKALDNSDIDIGKMIGSNLQELVQLNVKPNLNRTDHKSMFCILRTDAVEDVKKVYTSPNINDPWWMTNLAHLMKRTCHHKWCNSFQDLPEGKTAPNRHIILWNLNDQFKDIFFSTNPVQRATPTHNTSQKSTPTSSPSASKKSGLTLASLF